MKSEGVKMIYTALDLAKSNYTTALHENLVSNFAPGHTEELVSGYFKACSDVRKQEKEKQK